MENCIFCRIVAGEIPACKIYEDEQVLAFLDISQTTEGHSLVIPKQHVRNLLDMEGDLAGQLFSRVPMLARAVKEATGAAGLNVINNNEEAAGQTVFHAHIHLVPRYGQEDGISITYTTNQPDFTQLGQLADRIKETVQA